MPPKATYTRDQVIDAALNVVRDGGIKSLSARKIAENLGSSTTPVYQHYDSMADLERDVLIRIRDRLVESAEREYTGRVFLDIGVGFACFARDESGLFRALFMEPHDHRRILEELHEAYVDRMGEEPVYREIDRASRRALLWKMATYTIGLAVQIVNGITARDDNAFIIDTLAEAGHAVTKEHMAALGKQALPRFPAEDTGTGSPAEM